MEYLAQIQEIDRSGVFRAEGLNFGHGVQSRDPEHQLCHLMVSTGLEDGPIKFFRAGQHALTIASVHRAAKYRLPAECFPAKVKRSEPMSDDAKSKLAARKSAARANTEG